MVLTIFAQLNFWRNKTDFNDILTQVLVKMVCLGPEFAKSRFNIADAVIVLPGFVLDVIDRYSSVPSVILTIVAFFRCVCFVLVSAARCECVYAFAVAVSFG